MNPIDKERKSILDFCYILENKGSVPLKKWLRDVSSAHGTFAGKGGLSQEKCGLVSIDNTKGMYALFYDRSGELNYKGIMQSEDANQVSLSSVPKDEQPLAYMYCNLDAYSTYCKDYREYWKWVSERNEDRYNVNKDHGQNYDSKNMMHTIRLLQCCEQIFKTNTLNIRVENRDELLDIKYGNFSYEALMKKAETLMQSIDYHYARSVLPSQPDFRKTSSTLAEIRGHLYLPTAGNLK